MDLLGSYGSDTESEGEKAFAGPLVSRQSEEAAVANITEQEHSRKLSSKETDLTGSKLLDRLPAARRIVKKPVQYRPPINVAPDSSDEEERPKKKLKVSSKGLSLSAFLPPPKHQESSSVSKVLGGGHAKTTGRNSFNEDSDEEMAGPDPFQKDTYVGEGNEAYRVYDQLEGDVPLANGNGMAPPLPSAHEYNSHGMQGSSHVQPAAGDHLLQQALMEEASKAAKNGLVADPFSGVEFKEIHQQKLTYMPPEQREAKNATRTAFGADYEQRIRAEAGDEPEKKAKRKHQIHSLYHQAKMKELEMMELRGQAVKTKRETQAKYGWS